MADTDVYDIIRKISSYAFDTARAWMHAQIQLQPTRTDLEILKCIHSELHTLKQVIAENLDTEVIFLPEMTDHKYNHFEALQYVIGRHYTADGPSPPEYFQRICKYINGSRGVPCSQRVSDIQGMLPWLSPDLEARFTLILDQCNVQNWDGDDADPVPIGIVTISKDLILVMLMKGHPEPTIGATPCGGIDVVWDRPVNLYATFRNPELNVLLSVVTLNPDNYHTEYVDYTLECQSLLHDRVSEILVNGPPKNNPK